MLLFITRCMILLSILFNVHVLALNVDNEADYKRLDPDLKMLKSINSLSQQFLDAEKDFPAKTIPEAWKDIEFKYIVGCGMGCSSLHYQIFNSTNLSQHKIVIVNDYDIPKSIHLKDALVIGSSFSGNTEETLSCFKQAVNAGAKTIAITGKENGQLAQLAFNNNIPLLFLNIEKNQPRLTIGKYFTYLVNTFHELGLSDMFDINVIATNLKQQDLFTKTQKLASDIKGSTVIFYSGKSLMSTARIAKNTINENAKHPSFHSMLPEANHNEMEGYINATGKYTFILLSDPKDNPKIRERFEKMVIAVRKHSKANFISYIYQPIGQSKLERIFSILMWSHYLGYNLAIASNVKPEPVNVIECFKKQLKGNNCQ